MTSPTFIFAALCALAYLPLTGRSPGPWRSLVKTASVLGLALAAWTGSAPVLLVVALLACASGDFWLSRDGDRAFMFGVAGFAAGHLAYIALFLGLPGRDLSLLADGGRPLILAGLIVLGMTMAAALARNAGDLRIPVLLYVPVILVMAVSALALPMPLVGLAALAFVASDMILAAEVFLLPEQHPARRLTPYLVWPLYWGAQAGFCIALV